LASVDPTEGAPTARTPNRTLRSLALAATLSALAAPAASALPAEVVKDGWSNQEPPGTPVRVVTVETDRSFDWGDAGIGAGSGLALVLIGVGSALAVRHRPGRSVPAS
jgi:hypothetical protein